MRFVRKHAYRIALSSVSPPPHTAAAILVPSAEEVMVSQLRLPAVVWSVQWAPESVEV
jgi:hypothetical protein